MRSFFRAVVGVVVLVGIAVASEVRTTLALSGLTCAACSVAVTKALKQVDGVRDVTVTEDRQQAVVVADESVSPAALVAAVERAGFKATVAERSESMKSSGGHEANREKHTLGTPGGAPSTGATFEDVQGIEELRGLFNKDDGTARLILLLSPT